MLQESAREELAWLLAEDPSNLETNQNIVRTLLAERFHWDAAKVLSVAQNG